MYKNRRISVVIPCYNEEEGIRLVLGKIPDFVDEVVVVDNNSTDKTAFVSKSLGANVIVELRQGYGYAYKKGLKHAAGDIIVTMDGDGTYPVLAIQYLIDHLIDERLNFISARRVYWDVDNRLNYSIRFFCNILLNLTVRLLFWRNIYDSQSGMWVFEKKILPLLDATHNGMAFSEEIKLEAYLNRDIKAAEIPVAYKYLCRVGKSKLSIWGDGISTLFFLFKKRILLWRKRRGR